MAASSRAIQKRHGVPTLEIGRAGGFATYAGPDSPFNKVAGIGFQPAHGRRAGHLRVSMTQDVYLGRRAANAGDLAAQKASNPDRTGDAGVPEGER
jgi:hypothetical protein